MLGDVRSRLVIAGGGPDTDPVFEATPEELHDSLDRQEATVREGLEIPENVSMSAPSVACVLSLWDDAGNYWAGDRCEIIRIDPVE
jgi:hypothetical protein